MARLPIARVELPSCHFSRGDNLEPVQLSRNNCPWHKRVRVRVVRMNSTPETIWDRPCTQPPLRLPCAIVI